MEVGVICFNLAGLTGVAYCGSLLPLMASNSSNGAHLLSFHPPSLLWWGWQNMIKNRKTPFICVKLRWCTLIWSWRGWIRSVGISVGVHMHSLYVCVCVFMCRSRCTTIDGATKSLRQAECMVSVRNIRLSSICVCVCVCVCVCATERRGRRLWQSPSS